MEECWPSNHGSTLRDWSAPPFISSGTNARCTISIGKFVIQEWWQPFANLALIIENSPEWWQSFRIAFVFTNLAHCDRLIGTSIYYLRDAKYWLKWVSLVGPKLQTKDILTFTLTFIYFRNTILIINGCHFLSTSSTPTMRSMVSIRPWLASIQMQSTPSVFVWDP